MKTIVTIGCSALCGAAFRNFAIACWQHSVDDAAGWFIVGLIGLIGAVLTSVYGLGD